MLCDVLLNLSTLGNEICSSVLFLLALVHVPFLFFPFFLYSFFFLYNYLNERQSDRDRGSNSSSYRDIQRELLCMGSLPNDHCGPLARLNPEFHPLSHMAGRGPSTGVVFVCFLATIYRLSIFNKSNQTLYIYLVNLSIFI